MQKEFFMGIYCPPCPPAGDQPSRITDEVYSYLKKIGIKHVYGLFEDVAGEQYIKESLDLCEKNNMFFYPRLSVFSQFLGEKREGDICSYTLYEQLTEVEKDKVKKEFISWLNLLKEHPGCGGILISDERPYESFYGMGVASKLFAEHCPGKEFHYNALNYFGDDQTMFYRDGDFANKEICLEGDLKYNANNRFHRYKLYLDKYLDECETNHLSTDVYPFAPTWEVVPTSIHRSLYETSTILASYKKNRNLICYHCIQVGDWDMSSRVIDRAETALHMNISAAYQLDGYIFFPGVFPNDWLQDEYFAGTAHGKTGLLDCTGKPTVHYGYVGRLIEHMQVCAPVLLNAEWLGVVTLGTFKGGFQVELDKVEWNECIYQGGLPENEEYEYKGELPDIETDSQLFIGVFEKEEDTIYWIVNNSIVANVTFEVKHIGTWSMIMDGKTMSGCGDLTITKLNAGESILLHIKNNAETASVID